MRTTVLLLALVSLLAACGGEGSGGSGADGSSVDTVETTTTERAQEAIPLVAEALGADVVRASRQWQSCMAISWRHEAFATLSAPAGDASSQLDDVRAALTGAGYQDATQVDDHVTVTRDETTVDVQPTPARGEGTWTVTVRSECADYDGDDLERVENDEGGRLDGV
ncbi:hypothetical protein [Nocardioides flavus (ex Wang et al. 2016)]|uniref:hypothetical protein n=1 Tax=Nocardioides flavus (ex Wang et al. 2016) TaxID=2058780 RepID=UPI00174A31F6|nr:hypothetical protein [Nocardioides flavus (ex Wang et al. 2016)]